MRETGAERILRFVARGSGAVAGLSLAGMIAIAVLPLPGGVRGTLMTMLAIFSFAGGTSLLSMIGHLSLRHRRSDVDTEFWARLWMGRIGRVAFAIGRKLLGRRTVGPAMTHRATELSLGMAAEQLYESLPKATARGSAMFQGCCSGCSETTQYAEARATRDAIREKLGEAVGALETIRLNLLRLHAGSASVEGLTTHLNLAAEVSAGVERLITGQGEVERALSTPR